MLEAVFAVVNRTGTTLGDYAEVHHGQIRQLGLAYSSVPRPLLLVGHCLFVASLFRTPDLQRHWLVGFWVSFAAGFGGSTIASLMCNEPPAWLIDNWVLPTYFVCWWIIVYSHRNLGYHVYQILPVKAFCHAACNILRARSILAKVDLAVFLHGPKSFVAAIFLGTLSGVGGRFLSDLSLGTLVCPEKRLSELASPSWSLRSAFGAALFFWLTVYGIPVLPRDVAETLVVTAFVARGIASDVIGRPLDPTQPFAHLFHLLSGIPWPPVDADLHNTQLHDWRFEKSASSGSLKRRNNSKSGRKKATNAEREKDA